MGRFVRATTMKTFVGLTLSSLLFVSFLQTAHAGFHISPREAITPTGGTVRLECTYVSNTPVNWKHRPLGDGQFHHLYNQWVGMLKDFHLSGRHTIEQSSGRCDLAITNISSNDAGTYECGDDYGDRDDVELIVLDADAECVSNLSLASVLADNDCDLEPDHIEIRCSVGYHGNIPPVLELNHPNRDVMASTEVSRTSTSNTATVSRTLKASIDLDGTNFACSVKDAEPGRKGTICLTDDISVMYFFNTTESIEMPQHYQPFSISCVANTSQPCNYRWRGTSTSTSKPIDILGQTIDLNLFKQDFEEMRCSAECRILDKDCTVEPLLVKLSRTGDNNSSGRIQSLLILGLVVIVLGIVLLVAVVVLIWKCKKYFVECWNILSRIIKKKAIPEEQKLLLREHPVAAISNKGWIGDDVLKLVERLNPDQFLFDRLMSAGVLSVEDHKTLIEEDQDKENLLKILTRNINTRRTFNSFLAVVIEFDATVPESIQPNTLRLIEYLDVDNGLADSLFSRGVLTSEQYERLTNKSWWSSFQEQNRELLTKMLPSRLESQHACRMFMAALVETDQRHIFNFIMNSGDNVVVTEDEQRILTGDELVRLDRGSFQLINSIDPSPPFLESLLREDCITPAHKDRIDVQQTKRDKNKELLSIMRRRSYGDFKTFKRVIQETHKDEMVIRLLEQESGHVMSAHCVIKIEPGNRMSSEHLSMKETKIANHLSDPTILSQSLTQEVTNQLNGLHEVGIDMIGATPTGSVIVYFSCQTFQSIVAFKHMVVNGELTRILEELFNRILGLSALIHVKLIVSLSEAEYLSCIETARKTIYSETVSTDQQCQIRHLPREMIDLILLQSMVGIMSVEWMASVRDHESVSGSYNLYETVANKTWMSACISMKSVSYHWMNARCLNKRVVLKQFFIRRLQEQSMIFIEQLNCRYVLVDCLEKERIITEEERKDILEADSDVATRTYEDIPESCWPQMRDSEQMLMSNKELLKCLIWKNYSQTSKFLKLMEENCLTHILNYFIVSRGSQSFGDDWLLENERRSNIIKCGTTIVSKMNILVLIEKQYKAERFEEESGTKFNDGSKETDPLFPPYDETADASQDCKNPVDTVENNEEDENDLKPLDASETTIDTVGSQPEQTGSNLIDLLYKEGCISLLHKQHIEQQPTRQLQNLEMLQLIKNGSIKTFKVALEYFRGTNQDHVFDMLNRKYLSEVSEEINLEPTRKDVAGATWLEDRIYVVCDSSNKVHIFQDKGSFYELNRESIVVNGLSEPGDMVACKISRSIFISDSGNKCLWKIQIPEKDTSQKEIDDGSIGNISVASFDALLLVCVARDTRFSLNIYKTSDLFLMKSICLPANVSHLIHAVLLLNGNCIVCYSKVEDPDSFLISELSVGDCNFIRSFDPRSIRLSWNPEHSSIDEDENVFIADGLYDRVVLLNYRWTDVQILLNRNRHSIEEPKRLCYVREKQQLIIAPDVGNLRVFKLFPSVASTQLESELEIIKSGLLADMKPQPNMPCELVRKFEVKETKGESSVHGVAWLDKKIYVVCVDSNRVHVFPGEGALGELKEEGIKIKKMKDPWDISASQVSRSLFISDRKNKCLWRVQTPGKQTIQRKMEGKPSTLSITPSDELIVVVDLEDRYYLDVYDCVDINLARRIPLSTEIQDVLHAVVQSSTGNIILSHSTQNFPDVHQISELSADGTKIVRTFEPRTVGRSDMMHWEPDHLSLDGAGNIFVVDYRRDRVYCLNDQLTDCRIASTKYQHRLRGPYRLCFIRDIQQLIVGQLGEGNDPGLVCVLDLNMNN